MTIKANSDVFRMAAKKLERYAQSLLRGEFGYQGCCCVIDEDAACTKEKRIFRSMFDHETEGVFFWGHMPREAIASNANLFFRNQLARLIALDLAALIADEGEFNPKEWGR